MPTVGKKSFPYTKKGVAKAKVIAKKTGKKVEIKKVTKKVVTKKPSKRMEVEVEMKMPKTMVKKMGGRPERAMGKVQKTIKSFLKNKIGK